MLKHINNKDILCDMDGKILYINNTFKQILNIHNFNQKRIFNIIHSNDIIFFIKKYTDFINHKSLILVENVLLINKQHVILELTKTDEGINIQIMPNVAQVTIKSTIKLAFHTLEKIIFITRSKFIIGSVIPFIFSIFWSVYRYNEISYFFLILTCVAVILLHAAANTFNDYFDWVSGRDSENIDYVLSSTGGSRSIDFKIISSKMMLIISWIIIAIVVCIGVYIFYYRNILILIIGVIAFLSLYFYSAPPIHLASRYGLGELMHVFCLGPMITYGTTLALTNSANVIDFIIGFPFGLMITGCLLMNEYPDSKYDKISKKNNLAVVLGVTYIPYMYILLFLLTIIIITTLIYMKYLSLIFLSYIFILPYFYVTLKMIFLIPNGRYFIIQSCIKSFNIYFYLSIILIVSIIIELLI